MLTGSFSQFLARSRHSFCTFGLIISAYSSSYENELFSSAKRVKTEKRVAAVIRVIIVAMRFMTETPSLKHYFYFIAHYSKSVKICILNLNDKIAQYSLLEISQDTMGRI